MINSKSKHYLLLNPAYLLLIIAVLLVAGCHGAALQPVNPIYFSEFELATNFEEVSLEETKLVNETQFEPKFVFAPHHRLEGMDESSLKRIRPKKTPWGEAWNRAELTQNMNDVLLSFGIESEQARVRMIAHALVASGWRQNIWHFNAWGVQKGSWDGLWYEMPTVETDENGNPVYVPDAAWRAFEGWSKAIEDYQDRIGRHSTRPAYKRAARFLYEPGWRADYAFWEELGKGNYYTNKSFTPKMFTMLCFTVRRLLSKEMA